MIIDHQNAAKAVMSNQRVTTGRIVKRLPIQRRRLNVCNSFLVTVTDEKKPGRYLIKGGDLTTALVIVSRDLIAEPEEL